MKIGIVTGSFDLLHAGHIHLFREAKKQCDYLIVALHADPSIEREEKSRPVESILERTIKIGNCKCVDEIFIYENERDLEVLFKYCKPDIRFLGSDYLDSMDKPISYEDIVPIKYIDSLPIHTSNIREMIKR